jgi:hypothetical protein
VKGTLVHASITATMNLYAHAFPSIEATAADALDGMYETSQEGQGAPTCVRVHPVVSAHHHRVGSAR